MSEPTYNEGGYIAPGYTLAYNGTGEDEAIAVIHPDDCLISSEDVKARRWRCSRPGHPTETSDCWPRDDV